MLRKIDLSDLEKVQEDLNRFNWTFKHGDNIMYNFEVLKALYQARSNSPKSEILNKPITVMIVSIIEAILVDFLDRLHVATKHLPKNIPDDVIKKVKAEIENAKKPAKAGDGQIYYRRKMYKLSEIISILQRHQLFGPKDSKIYELLGFFGDMRNRVHIENYNGKLEQDEAKVFTTQRLLDLEQVLELLWEKMVSDYKRPWAMTA